MNDNTSYRPVQTSGLAIASLISGICGWTIVPVIGSIIAVVTGHMAKNEIRRSNGTLDGSGMATAGLVLGYVGLALALIGFCLVALILFGAITIPWWNFNSGTFF